MHALIYTLFIIHAKHIYTPNEWCRSVACLLYKQNKGFHNISYYITITLTNVILTLWTSILININSPSGESHGILGDTADGFRRHKKIYNSLSTHIIVYEDAKM